MYRNTAPNERPARKAEGTRRRGARTRTALAVVAGIFLTIVGTLAPAVAHADQGHRPQLGVWHRLNPSEDNPAPQHERLRCREGDRVWQCRYDLVPEPTLNSNDTVARFTGRVVTSSWECPEWFAEHCADVVTVVAGKARVTLDDGTRFSLGQTLIVTEVDGQEVLWAYLHDFGVVSPWFRTFDEAVLAAGFTPPYIFDGTNWPPPDYIFP